MKLNYFAITALLAAACGPSTSDSEGGGETGTTTGAPDGSTSSEASTAPPGTTEAPPPEEDESSSGEPVQECDRCVAAAPEGWFGPLALHAGAVGDDAPPCGGGWSQQGLTHTIGFVDPGPAECDCACSVNIGALCPMPFLFYPQSSECAGDPQMADYTGADGCFDLTDYDVGDGGIYLFQLGFGPDPVSSCESTSTETIADPSWASQISACRVGDGLPACNDGGHCAGDVPDGYSASVCIFQEGDHACPAGEYSEKTLAHGGVDDTRDCSVCECGEEHTAVCDGTFELHDSEDCGGMLVAEGLENTSCSPADGAVAIMAEFTGDPACPVAAPPEPEGEIVPADPVTYCCQAG